MDWKVMNKRISLAILLTAMILTLGLLPNLAYSGVLPDPGLTGAYGPRSDELHMIPYANPAAVFAALKAGDLEYMNWPLTAAQYEEAVVDLNIQLAATLELGMREFDLNNNETCKVYPGVPSPTGYPDFRKALAHLTDKEYIVSQICKGFASRLDVPIPAPSASWYNPNVTGVNYPYNYNPVTAAALLNAMGFVEGTTTNTYYDPTFPSSAQKIRVYPDWYWKHENPHVGDHVTGPPYVWTLTASVIGGGELRVFGDDGTGYRKLVETTEWSYAAGQVTVTIALQECTYIVIWYQCPNPHAGEDIDPLVFYSRSDDPDRFAAGDHLRDNMRKMGIPVDYKPGSSSYCYPPVMGAFEYHIYTGGWGLGRYPTFCYFGFNTDWNLPYWYNYIVFPCIVPERAISYDPRSDQTSAAIYYTLSLTTAKEASMVFQEAFIENCLNIPLWSQKSYYAYRNLLGTVNMAGVGFENEYNFLNFYRADDPTKPVRIGNNQPPKSLNILESEWTYEYSILDRMHTGGFSINPYDLAIDQPWIVQDWHTTTWYDEEDSEIKSKTTYWLRKDVWYHTPVTGAYYRELTAQDAVFTASQTVAFPGSWPYTGYNDIHHIVVVDDYCFEVYYDAASYWLTYAADGYPFLPKDIWLESAVNDPFTNKFVVGTNFTDSSDFADTEYPVVLGYDYKWCTISLTKDATDYTIELFADCTVKVNDVEMDCWPLDDPANKQLNPNTALFNEAMGGFTPWLNFTYLTGETLTNGDSFTVSYYGGVTDTGLTPGNEPWQTIYTGVGEWYMKSMPGGIAGPFVLGACRQFFYPHEPLGEVDWRWKWGAADETRGFDQTVPSGPCTTKTEHVAPRKGSFKIDTYDWTTIFTAWHMAGNKLPDDYPKWFTGADLVLDECWIDIFDETTCTAQDGQTFGEPP